MGTIERPSDRNLQADPIQLESREIAREMSGAAVLDIEWNLVVGKVAERFFFKNSVQDDIGFGVDTKVLMSNPLDFVLRGEALALLPAPEFRLDGDLLAQAVEISQFVLAHRAPGEKYSWYNASAREHHGTALKIARGISHRPALIEALLARGRWVAKYHKEIGDLVSLDQAFNDLNEALG